MKGLARRTNPMFLGRRFQHTNTFIPYHVRRICLHDRVTSAYHSKFLGLDVPDFRDIEHEERTANNPGVAGYIREIRGGRDSSLPFPVHFPSLSASAFFGWVIVLVVPSGLGSS